MNVAGEIKSVLADLISQYPDVSLENVAGQPPHTLRELMLADLPRFAFELDMLISHAPRGATLADVGGGMSVFTAAAARLGYRCYLLDDFRDRWHSESMQVLELHRSAGVEVISCDVLKEDLPLPNDFLDVVTSFDCIEHLHSSPKAMFQRIRDALKPGGTLIVGAPNCVNLRKRITVPFGRGKWSQMEEWYEDDVFRGHVREPDVEDLKYIGRSLNLSKYDVLGRNWLGYTSRYPWVRALTPFADKMLRLRPSVCSNIYLVGTK